LDNAPNRVIVASFCLMVASFHFEMPDGRFHYQLPSMAAALFTACTALQPRVCYRRLPAALLWSIAFLFAYCACTLLHGWNIAWDMRRMILFLVQAIFVFWAAANLLADERVSRKVLWAFAAASVVRAALPFLGIGRTTYQEHWTGGERVSAWGQDPNFASTLLSAGALALIWLTHARPGTPRWLRLLTWPAVTLITLAILDSGSRGGMLALAAGLLGSMLRYTERVTALMRQVLLGVVAIAALGFGAMNTEVMRGRVEATTQGGSLAGREKIFPALWDMFLERPLTGWGPQLNHHEIALRAPYIAKEYRDSHNLFLEVMTATGLVGTVPFFVALGLCVAAAWRGRRGDYGILPFALLSVLLVANLSIDMLLHKPLWFVLGFTTAGASRLQPDA